MLGNGSYRIHEIYHSTTAGGDLWTVSGVVAEGNTMAELRKDLLLMAEATLKPAFKPKKKRRAGGST